MIVMIFLKIKEDVLCISRYLLLRDMVKDATHHPDYKVIHFVIFSLLLNYLILIELFLAQSLFSYQLVALIFVIIISWSSIFVILMCNPSGVLSRGECGKRIVRSSSREILKKIAATFWSKVDEYIVVLNLQDIILFGQFFWEEQYFGDWCINTTLATSSCHIVNIGHLSWSGHLLAIQCLVQQNVSLKPSWTNNFIRIICFWLSTAIFIPVEVSNNILSWKPASILLLF